MSNRRRPRNDTLAAARFSGGCDDCNAYQTVHTDGGLVLVTVHHDNTCPYLNGTTS